MMRMLFWADGPNVISQHARPAVPAVPESMDDDGNVIPGTPAIASQPLIYERGPVIELAVPDTPANLCHK